MNPRRALILQGGVIRGAFSVGVVKRFYKLLTSGYFEAIFSTSVGIFEQVFAAALQPDIMEAVWRDHVCDRKLINLGNLLRSKPILDLDYLIDLFRSQDFLLNLDNIKKSPLNLFSLVSEYRTRRPELMDLKREDVFEVMKATCALPFVYPREINIRGNRYVDGGLANPFMAKIVFGDIIGEFDEVIAVLNSDVEDPLVQGAKILKPNRMPLFCSFDTNRQRIIETIKQGEIDAHDFIKRNKMPAS